MWTFLFIPRVWQWVIITINKKMLITLTSIKTHWLLTIIILIQITCQNPVLRKTFVPLGQLNNVFLKFQHRFIYVDTYTYIIFIYTKIYIHSKILASTSKLNFSKKSYQTSFSKNNFKQLMWVKFYEIIFYKKITTKLNIQNYAVKLQDVHLTMLVIFNKETKNIYWLWTNNQ
jgi:hypothetical protein